MRRASHASPTQRQHHAASAAQYAKRYRLSTTAAPAACHLRLGKQESLKWKQQQPVLRTRHYVISSSTSSSLGDSAGDLDPKALRPKAQVSAPPAAPPEATSSSSSSSSSSSKGGASSQRPYSEFYKSQNTVYYQAPPGVSSSSSNGKVKLTEQSDKPGHPTEPGGPGSSSSGNGAATAAVPGPAPAQSPGAVEEAIKKAQAALAAAESTLSSIEGLASAKPPARWAQALVLLRQVAITSAVCSLMVASHAFGLAWQWAAATLGALGIAGWGYKKNCLSPSGAIAAAVVGLCTLGCSLRFGATLIAFFLSSSKLTQFKEELKEGLDDESKKGGQRDWRQVCCNAAIPTMMAVAYGALAGCLDLPLGALPSIEPWRADIITLLMGGFLGYYACCCGDTWASELGVLSTDQPRLITNLKPVRRGTNGGVTLLGLSASLAGGLFVGLVFYLTAIMSPTLWVFDLQRQAAIAQWRIIPLGLVAGLFGSLLDSLLGATVQFTGYDRVKQKITGKPGPDVTHISGWPFLSNNLVNLISATSTSALTALIALRLFG